MKFICITKKQIIIILFILIIICCFIIFYNSYTNEFSECDDFLKASSDGVIITNLQDKLNNIYTSNEKIAYLTFDDGPTKIATKEILDILKENNIKASFFVIGYRVK